MSDMQKRIADIAEGYFRDLERQAYDPNGCNGDDLAAWLLKALDEAGYEIVKRGGGDQ